MRISKILLMVLVLHESMSNMTIICDASIFFQLGQGPKYLAKRADSAFMLTIRKWCCFDIQLFSLHLVLLYYIFSC